MKHINKILLLFAFVLSAWHLQAQSPPTTYVDLGTASQTSTQTPTDTITYYKWVANQPNYYGLFKMQTQGLINRLSRFEVYKNVSGTLVQIGADTLQADSTMRFYYNDATSTAELYLKVYTSGITCTGCTPAYPTFALSTQTFVPVKACSTYTQPSCDIVVDGDFEYSNAPCDYLYTTGQHPSAFSNSYPNGDFVPCFWNLAKSTPTGHIPGTADWFNTCAPTYSTSYYGANANANLFSLGNTVSLVSGNGYAGLYAYDYHTSNNEDYREYITAALSTSLVANQTYSMSMYVQLTQVSTYGTILQVGFSNTQPQQNSANEVITTLPYVVNMTTRPVTNKSGWTLLSTTFTPTVGYTGLTIGNFQPNASIVKTAVSGGTFTNTAYYYIDKVSIMPIPTNIVASVSQGTICNGQSAILTGTNATTYTWMPGSLTGSLVTVTPTTTTVYTVTGTNNYSCTTTATVQVTVVTPPNMTVTPTTQTICTGGTATITASGANTYTWTPGSITGATLNVSPSSATVYTVAGTYSNCASRSITATVTVNSPPSVSIATTTPNCPSSTYTLSASGSSTYTWSPGSATTASIAVTPTVPTVYTVQSVSNGCTGIATASINPVICCTCGNAITETSSTTTYSAGNYNLNHTFTVTSNYTLNGMTILMGSQAEIVVANGVKLDLVTTHLLGCNGMWKGIRFVGSQGTITTSKNVLIEDAITAVDLSQVTGPAPGTNTLIIDAQDVTFNKNRTGISIGTYTNSGYYPSNFKSAVFTCRRLITTAHSVCLGLSPVNYTWTNTGNQTLKTTSYTPSNSNISTGSNVKVTDDFSVSAYASTNLEVPYQNTFSQYGIYLNGTGLTNTVTLQGFQIGNSGTDFTTLNLFDNLCYGIYAIQANVTSQNSGYQYMRQNSTTKYHSLPMYSGGVGIYAENNQTTGTNYAAALNVLPVTTGTVAASFNKTGNFFFNNPYGIVTANMQYVDVEYAMIHSNRTSTTFTTAQVPSGEYGVYMKNFDYRNIKVLNNVAANVGVGVSFYGAYFTKPKTATQYAGAVSISTNTLQANYPGGSLTSRALKLGIVADNAVNCYSCTISGSTSSNILINNNNILNAYSGITSSNWANQITTTGSNSVTLVDNGVSSAQQFGIQHVNNYADIVTTNTVTGFNTTKIPVQAIRADFNYNQQMTCNYTSNTYDGFYFTGAANLTHWMGNNMTTHKRGMTLWNSAIGQQGASGSPIYNSWNGTWTGNFQTYVQGADPGSTGSTMYFLSSQIPTINGSNFSTNGYKAAPGTPVSLFTTTGVSPSCVSTGTVVNGHHHLLAFRSNLISMAANSYSYVPYMSGNDQNGLYSVYREIIEDTSLMAGNSALKSLYTDGNSGIYNHFNLAENDLFNLSDSLAQVQVNAMSPTTSVETNTQNFYSLYLKLRDNSYNSTDDSTLLALANACPSKDGRVVYQARVLYNAAHDFSQQFYNACDTVTVGKPGHSDLTNSPVSANFIVYPNPNNGNLFLSADNIGLSSYTVRVFDITGKIVLEREYSEGGIKSLSIGAESGIYMVEVIDAQLKTTYRQKIVIQR